MDTGDKLLRAVLLDPADDGPRLVYADWLEEQGQDARAEFIRLQCELARLPDCSGELEAPRCDQVPLAADSWCRSCALRRRERDLKDPAWLAWDNWPLCRAGGARHVYRRGFVERVTLRCAAWLEHGPAAVACQPVTAVTLSDRRATGGAWRCADPAAYTQSLVSPAALPPVLWQHLPRLPFGCAGGTAWAEYLTEDAARRALSIACVAFARERAGLPPLPEPAG